jgi:hypothetical protein
MVPQAVLASLSPVSGMTSSSGSQVSTSTWKSRRAPVLLPERRIAQTMAAAALRKVPSTARIWRWSARRWLGGLARSRFEDLPSEMIEDRLQPGVVGQFVEVGEGALAELGDRELFLSLSGLAKILDRPEGAQRRIEEGEQIRDKDIVEEEVTIAVRVLFAKLVDEPFEGVNLFGPGDWLGPDRQIARGQDRRSRALGSLGRWS